MRRALAKQPPRCPSFNEIDIENKKWKRKSYALAQYNTVHMDPIPADVTYFPPPTTTPQATPSSVHHAPFTSVATTPSGSQTHLVSSSRQESLSVIYPTPPPSATPSLRASQDLISMASVPTLCSSLTSLNSETEAKRSSISESPDFSISNDISPQNHITCIKEHDTGQGLKEENSIQKLSIPEVVVQQSNGKQILPNLQNIKPQEERRVSIDFFSRLKNTGLIPYLEAPQHSDGSITGISVASKDDQVTDTFWTRFYILTIASLVFFMQCIIWGTFGPISESVQRVYLSWDEQTLALFILNAAIVVTLFTMPMMWLSQKFGLRFTMILCTSVTTISATLRCFSSEETSFTALCYICSVTNAFSTCLALALPPTIAATWFPPNERTTATAIGALATQLGGAGMYFAPLLVSVPDKDNREEVEKSQDQIMHLMYIYAGTLWVLLCFVLVYFPARPPLPPSLSSTVEHLNFAQGFKSMIKNRQVCLTMVTYCFSFGIPVVWVGVLNISLEDMEFRQDEIMWVGICSVSSSGMAAFITAVISDKLFGHLRITICGLLAASSACFLWFLLLALKVIHPTIGQVAAAVTGGISFQFACVPLLMEMTVEMVYPCSENVVGAVLTTAFNIVSTTFLLMFQIPAESYVWVPGVLLASQSLTIIPLLFVKETYNRTTQDNKNVDHDAKE